MTKEGTIEAPRSATSVNQPGLVKIVLATLGFYLFLTLGSLVLGSLAILVGWFPPRGNLVFDIARFWSMCILRISGVEVKAVHPLEGLHQGAAVFMSNHQSIFDIPALIATLPGQTRFLAKRSLFFIPIFGWALAVGGFIPVDRKRHRSGHRTLKAAAQRISRGMSILIFPEQTRSRDGRLLPFKSGGIVLAIETGAPIVPVGIRGAYAVRRAGSWIVRPGKIEVRYGRPIGTGDADVARRKTLTRKIRQHVGELAGMESR